MVSSSEIDRFVLTAAKPRWQKVAKIIAVVADQLGMETSDEELQPIADRIVALISAGQMESQGNLERWRFSEVRLLQPERDANHEE